MKVEFFGVRGSVPSPGPDTSYYGGNTSCVLVSSDCGQQVILDSGTGIIGLGERLIKNNNDISILLTHNHWDHIQGFPFFKPIYQPNRPISVFAGQVDCDDKSAIAEQMSGSRFPVKFSQLPADIKLDTETTAKPMFNLGSFDIKTQLLNHPDGGTAYVIENNDIKLAYVTDNELSPPYQVKTTLKEWEAFIHGADLLIHDAQFIDEDLPEKHGWGHSTIRQVAELAVAAKVKSLALISHDPFRKDKELQSIEKTIQEQFSEHLSIFCAREGSIIDLGES